GERGVSESNVSLLRVLQYISTKLNPSWVQSINRADLLRSRPLLQLRFSSDSIASVAIMLIVDQFLALILGRESSFNPLSVLPSSPVTSDLLRGCKEPNRSVFCRCRSS